MNDFAPVFARVARRYRLCGRGTYGYMKGKLTHDPVHRDVLTLAAEEHFGYVLDIGCGRGQLGIALLEAGLASSVLGIDRREGHLAQARDAAGDLPYCTVTRDLSSLHDAPRATTVLLIDVLYQLANETQHAVLRTACCSARERIIIRTLDPDRGARSLLTLGLERLMRPLSPHSGAWVNPWKVTKLLAVLKGLGFVTSVTPCWGKTPFANILIIGQRTR
jgi:2-polyprenyl-3-methyl-5-hydroxy-6-metoxy-1,4-benzoquinol methylase